MGKKGLLIDRFDGGENSSNSPDKIEKGQLANANDVQFRKTGRVETMGEYKTYNDVNVGEDIFPGFGLHHYNVPHGFKPSDAGATVTTHAQGFDAGQSIAFCSVMEVLGAFYYYDLYPEFVDERIADNVPYVFK